MLLSQCQKKKKQKKPKKKQKKNKKTVPETVKSPRQEFMDIVMGDEIRKKEIIELFERLHGLDIDIYICTNNYGPVVYYFLKELLGKEILAKYIKGIYYSQSMDNAEETTYEKAIKKEGYTGKYEQFSGGKGDPVLEIQGSDMGTACMFFDDTFDKVLNVLQKLNEANKNYLLVNCIESVSTRVMEYVYEQLCPPNSSNLLELLENCTTLYPKFDYINSELNNFKTKPHSGVVCKHSGLGTTKYLLTFMADPAQHIEAAEPDYSKLIKSGKIITIDLLEAVKGSSSEKIIDSILHVTDKLSKSWAIGIQRDDGVVQYLWERPSEDGYTALYNYSKENDIELSVNKGDNLTLLDKTNEDWWYMIDNNGDKGYVPPNYILRVSEVHSTKLEDEAELENITNLLSAAKKVAKAQPPQAAQVKKAGKRVHFTNNATRLNMIEAHQIGPNVDGSANK